MKKPVQNMGIERMLLSKVDVEKWGPAGRELVQKVNGMRERMKGAAHVLEPCALPTARQ